MERVEHDDAGDPEVGSDRQGVTGVIVEPGEDLDVDQVGEAVVGEVGLPHLVGLLGLEPDVGRAGPLARGWRDQPAALQGAVDRRSRHPELVMLLEVPADRVRPGVQTSGGEPTAELDDQLDGRFRDRRR
jgi:hypothetical protein